MLKVPFMLIGGCVLCKEPSAGLFVHPAGGAVCWPDVPPPPPLSHSSQSVCHTGRHGTTVTLPPVLWQLSQCIVYVCARVHVCVCASGGCLPGLCLPSWFPAWLPESNTLCLHGCHVTVYVGLLCTAWLIGLRRCLCVYSQPLVS